MEMIYWDHYYNAILLINLLIITGLFASLRLFSGTIAHIKASDELLKKDNPAFGISLAGATFAVTIMLSGTIYGSPEQDMVYAVQSVGLYGILGIALMALTRIIFNKVTLPGVKISEEIVAGNKAAAIADAGNVLAAAIIIRAAMVWVTAGTLEGVAALLVAYVVSQIVLTAMTVLTIRVFKAVNDGNCIQDELNRGNIALALRFAGRKIGTAFAIAAAAKIVVYEEYEIMPIFAAWLVASLIAIAVVKALTWVAERVILWKIDLNAEVIGQRNVALGALQAVIAISLGLLVSQL